MKIKEILEYGKNNLIREDGYKLSKMLLKYLLKVNDSYLIINNDKDVNLVVEEKFKEGIELLKAGMPLQYVTNIQEFMKLDFYVDKNVLIPQPDTEILVEEIINLVNNKNTKNNTVGVAPLGDLKKYKILDLCTGSGAIGVSIAKYIDSFVTMSDISDKALEIAKKNATNNGVANECKFILSNMFESIDEKFDVIVSNPPYIRTKVIFSLDKEVQNEPYLALDGGEDGLHFYRIIAENAYKYLNENGILVLEIGYDQKDEVINLLKSVGKYNDVYCKHDLSGNDRVIVAKVYNI